MKIDNYIINGLLKIRVKPNTAKTEIKGYSDERKCLLVNINAIPDKNKANLEVIKFFSRILKKKVMSVQNDL